MIKTKEFVERRRKLYDSIEDNSVIIMFAGIGKKFSEDEDFNFFANRNFYYLTNIEQEESVFIALKTDGLIREFLFIQPFDELKEKWTGKRLTRDEAVDLSGIENVLFVDMLDAQIDLFINKKNKIYGIIENVYLDMDVEQKIAEDKDGEAVNIRMFKNNIELNYPYLQFKNINRDIMLLRMVKSASEVEEFKGAVDKTNMGLKNIMKALKPGLFEYQLSALFYYTIQDYDKSELAFPTISSGGVNATCLHYTTSLEKIKDGDLVQLDLGAKNNGYCADISRVYPANGKFSPMQKLIYEIVLGCNKMVINTIKPGITIKELQEKVIEYLANHCFEAGLIKNKEDIKQYYFHNISHHIGLDTHDISDREIPLQAGNIISDEPGLYFKELGIGVRIEDDILVTEDGCYCLSGNIIKEVSDIEKAMLFK